MANLNSHDDYSLSRVPLEGKQAVWKVMVVRLGGLSCLPILMMGAALGYGLTFWQGFWAIFFGSVILQVVGWAIGTAAAKEGLGTSLLSRWMGFGNIGSSLISLVIAITCFGWFGIQNSVFAEGLLKATGILSFPVWSIITGIGVTLIVLFGFKYLSITANIALPLFVIGVFYAFVKMIAGNSLSALIASPAPGAALPMTTAITVVAGSYMLGAVLTPDVSRFVKTGKDVFWMVLVSTFVGELGFGLIGLLMAHAVKSADVTSIMLSLSGVLGVSLVIFSTVKINDINLYSASLGITNLFDSLFNLKLNRATVTIFVGVFGTILSIVGILNHFISFLTLLGVIIPPIGGIMVTDYFILKRSRKILDDSRTKGTLPEKVEVWNPITLVSWLGGSAFGYFSTGFGVPSVNSLVTSMVLYYIVTKIYSAVSGKADVECITPKGL